MVGVSLPEADTPAPARLLPQYDNLLLSHKDRSRFIPAGFERMNAFWMEQRGFVGSVLVDGMIAGLWRIEDSKQLAPSTRRALTMTITTPNALVDDAAAGVSSEAERFLRFAAGLSAEEAAAVMGRRAGTVRGLTFRAIASLRRRLQAEDDFAR